MTCLRKQISRAEDTGRTLASKDREAKNQEFNSSKRGNQRNQERNTQDMFQSQNISVTSVELQRHEKNIDMCLSPEPALKNRSDSALVDRTSEERTREKVSEGQV